MSFFKLDTGQLDGFDTALSGKVVRFSTKSGAVLRCLSAHLGVFGTLSILLGAMFAPGATGRKLVAGNLARKQIRLPSVFGNRVVSAVYGWGKAAQAVLLKEALDLELAARNPDTVIIYNGSLYPESVLAFASGGRKRVFIEAGFFPGTLQIDPIGLNAANSVPRDAGFYLGTDTDYAAAGLPTAVNNRKSKARSDGEITLEPGYVFVPFQVPSDMQVTVHSPWVRDMEMFLDVVLAAADRNPDETFVIKEHPSFKRSVKGTRPDHPRVIFANDNVTSDLIQNSRAVLTLNSTVGIEALLFDRPVITLGDACYNIEGLVFHAETESALDAALSASDGWTHDPTLRRQFLGFLRNTYLVSGKYDALPENLADTVQQKARNTPTGPVETTAPQTPVQIAVASDQNMIEPALVVIGSVVTNTPRPVHVHFLGFDLPEDTRARITAFCQKHACVDHYHDITAAHFGSAKQVNDDIPLIAMSRMHLPDMVSGRILYLDCDMLVSGDVAEIFEADLNNAPLAAVRDFFVLDQMKRGAERPEKLTYHRSVLGREDVSGYFNSGLLLFDCDCINQDAALKSKLLDFSATTAFRFADQDHLNVVFDGRTKFLPLAWNDIWGKARKRNRAIAKLDWLPDDERAPRATCNIHYTGPKKPWKAKILSAAVRGRLPAILKWQAAARKFL